MQINLLYANGTKLTRLLPAENESNEFFDTEMSQQQNALANFNQPCSNCILQLLKQANDLSNGYLYVSCSDVNIINESEANGRKNDETECQRRGEWKSDSKCTCDATHEGEYCQISGWSYYLISVAYKVFLFYPFSSTKYLIIVDCKNDSDCGDNGVCKNQWNSDNSKICYCQFGRFGRNCELESKIDSNDKCFNVNGLRSDNRMDFVSYGLFDESCYKQVFSKQINNVLAIKY